MTSRTQILSAKKYKSPKLKTPIPKSQVARIIDGDEEFKNIAEQVLTSTNFNSLNKKLDLERFMSELGKSFLKIG